MNNKKLVKLSNIIGIISIFLLIYWVFIFVSIEVFSLKVFQRNLTRTFYLSILGIFALMVGALIINIMFNLTRIAEKHNSDISDTKKISKKVVFLFILSFPLIFGSLVTKDYITTSRKEKVLISSAKLIIENDQNLKKLNNYTFTKEWINSAAEMLNLSSKLDTYFPSVSLIVADEIDGNKVYLKFGSYNTFSKKDIENLDGHSLPIKKINYIRNTTNVEREYLEKVFYKNSTEIRFSAYNGRYELFYPYKKNGQTIVFYFSDYQEYAK
ncbi:hypothetical protein [Fusobacterium sp. PH5-44]|uniref:hypothetical protein n=1 Tax=unclassified Fusobacterium TaxID=2648384 RepID=UPI003D23AE05